MTLGEIAALALSVGTLLLGVWTRYGQGRESAQTREDRVKAEMAARIADLEKQRADCETRADTAEEGLSVASRRLATCVDFLNDVVGDSYALEWIRKRAAELLRRLEK